MKWVATLPTTNLRILLTLVLAFATGVKHIAIDAWTPGWEWLGFLCIWAGLDVAQFTAKRMTSWQPGEAPPP